jgi:chromosome segregation ATPase
MKSDSGGEMESCRSSDSELERELHEKEREIQTLHRELTSGYRSLAERDTELVRIRLECQRLLEDNRHLREQTARCTFFFEQGAIKRMLVKILD